MHVTINNTSPHGGYDGRKDKKMNRDELRKASNERLFEELNYCGFDTYYREYRQEILAEIRARIERPKEKWITTRTLEHDGELYCNKCGQEHPNQKIIWNYCPNCGTKMEVGE